MSVFERLNLFKSCPRTPSTVNWFSAYDANVIGGLMVGAGMTLTGACPGTVLVQLSTGIRSGMFVMLGGFLGGILHARFGRLLTRKSKKTATAASNGNHTVQSKLGLNPTHVLLAYEAACLVIITLATSFVPHDPRNQLNPVIGGLLIGGAQAASILLTTKPVGVSTAYEEIGQYFWRAWDSLFASSSTTKTEAESKPRPSTRAIQFAIGILLGSYALTHSNSGFPMQKGSSLALPEPSNMASIVGGFVMVFGARLAGGCTSGHGISGMAMMSISSIVTVAAMFGGGIGLAALLKA